MLTPKPLVHHLIRAVLVATLLPLMAMVGLDFWQYRKDLAAVEGFTGTEGLASARVVSNFMDFLVDDTRSLLQEVARRVERGEHLTVHDLRRLGDSQRQTDGIEIADERGVITLSSLGQTGRKMGNLAYFKDARDHQAIAYSDVFYSQYLHQNVVMIAAPYQHDGHFGGVVIARLNLKELNALLSARLADPALRNTLITDRHGTLIAHQDLALVTRGDNAGGLPPVQQALAGGTGWIKYRDPADHQDHVSGYMPMSGTGWAIVATRTAGQGILDVGSRFQHQLVLALLAALVAWALALFGSRWLARPLEALETSMRRARSSGFEVGGTAAFAPTNLATNVREYETLAECYNAMAAAIGTHLSQITALQAELQEKNKELAAHNDLLATQNQKLTELSAQAQASNQLKSEFLANMSHELRTPLNAIIGFTVLTLTDERLELDPQNRHNLETVEKSARHLLTLINGVLDLSKIESGRTSVFIETFDPRELLDGVMRTMAPLALERGVELVQEVVPGVGTVASDQTKLKQIVINLVANALKFTPQGRVTVTLRPAGAERWAIAIADTGIGIAPEHQEMVFEEFRQVDASTTRKAGGTGLGLSIARKLARMLGGDLTLASAPGRGSTFTLELPRRPAEAPDQAGEPRHDVAPHPRTADDRLVLVIDDDPQMLYFTASKLESSPYALVAANSGAAGLELARRLQPYAILLDVKVRRSDDWEILRALKADPRTAEIPVVVMCFEENRPLAVSLGASAYLAKPIDRDALERTLDSLSPPAAPPSAPLEPMPTTEER